MCNHTYEQVGMLSVRCTKCFDCRVAAPRSSQLSWADLLDD